MAASQADIRDWFLQGLGRGAEYMIVFCDTWDHTDYPSLQISQEAMQERLKKADQHERVMEIYHLGSSFEFQMAETRARHEEPIPGRPLEPEYDKMRPEALRQQVQP